MENDGDGSGIDDSFLPDSRPFMIQEEADDSLGGVGDSDGGGDSGRDGEGFPPLREQDRFLPIANVARIMKKAIPKSGKIAKDARECVQECVSEFISFITSEASDRCRQEKRKTINGEDILFAISTLGFDSYVEPLKLYLQKYRDAMKGERLAGGGTGTGSGSEMPLEEINDETFTTMPTQTLTSGVITTDQGQQNVIYATAYPTQVYINATSAANVP